MNLPVASDFCAVASVELDEPIVGTAAAKTSVWLGIEIRGAWPHDALMSDAVPEVLRTAVRTWAAAIPGFRPQGLRRPGRDNCVEPAVFVALTHPEHDVVVRLDVGSLEALAATDLPAVVDALRSGEVPDGARVVETPMAWVCVHGKRDRCCAKFGTPVYEAASRVPGVDAWHTSHLGGHRFAATLLCLPRGICYGRVKARQVEGLLGDHAKGRVHDLEVLRGRTCWTGAGQAAVHFARAYRDVMAVDDVAPLEETAIDDRVSVIVRVGDERLRVQVERRSLGSQARPSCAKPPAPVKGWFLVDLEACSA